MLLNLLQKIFSLVFPFEVKIHYIGGGANYTDIQGKWSAQEGKTDCWEIKRFISEWTARRFINRSEIELRQFDERSKKFIVEYDVD